MAWAPIIARDLPRGSRLASRQGAAYYSESYEAPLSRYDLKMHEIYLAIVGHLPWWARALIIIRNFIVFPFGLHAETAANVWNPKHKDSYAPGDRIVRFDLYSLDDDEIVSGRDDRHLDFRLSVMRIVEKGAHKIVMSTLIFAHNRFGRMYLLFVLPLHRVGVRHLLSQAVTHGRI